MKTSLPSTTAPSPGARRASRVDRWWGGRWALRCGALAVIASGAGVVPVVSAGAAPQPVTPTSQVLEVPVVAVDGTPTATPSSSSSTPSPSASATPSATPSAATPTAGTPTAATGREAVPSEPGGEPLEELATGPVRTKDFNLVSVVWDGDPEADVDVQVRVRTDDGWSGWQPLEVEDSAPDPGTQEAEQAAGGGSTSPLWVSGGADAVDVRVSVPADATTPDGEPAVQDVRTSLVDPKASVSTQSAAATPAASAQAASSSLPGVITRAQWGADESLRLSKCSAPSYTSTPKVAFVHHTAGSNTYTAAESAAIVRGIYYQHTVVQGWCDIGYNFLVDKYGQVFEGRFGGMDRAVLGAHAGGFNAGSFGVSVLGNYETAKPTAAITEALARVISWKLSLSQTDPTGRAVLYSAGLGGTNLRYPAGTAVTLNTISGHRDVGATACPGANLYSQLPALRKRVAQLMAEKEWELRTTATPGASDGKAYFGDQAGTALACDWDGDGTDGLAVYSAGRWAIKQTPGNDDPDLAFSYGSSSMLPVCGDWNGDGVDGVGVYDPATYTWWLRETASPGAPDRKFVYGFKGVKPVAGDWDGVGRSGIGVYDGYRWWLRGTATPGGAGAVFPYGWPQATPVVGDWDGDGRDTVGVYATGAWWLRNSITPGQPDSLFGYGAATDRPVVGRWDVSGLTSTGASSGGSGSSSEGSGDGDAATGSSRNRGDGVGVWRTWP